MLIPKISNWPLQNRGDRMNFQSLLAASVKLNLFRRLKDLRIAVSSGHLLRVYKPQDEIVTLFRPLFVP